MSSLHDVSGMSSLHDADTLLVQSLTSPDPSTQLQSIRRLKHVVIGNQSKKQHFSDLGVVRQLAAVLEQCEDGLIVAECVTVLGSLALGASLELSHTILEVALNPLLQGLMHDDPRIVLATLRALKTIYQINDDSLGNGLFESPQYTQRMVELMLSSSLYCCYAATIISSVCKKFYHQDQLASQGIVPALMEMLGSSTEQVMCDGLNCAVKVISKNKQTATLFLQGNIRSQPVLHTLISIISSHCSDHTLLACANCLTCVYRLGLLTEQTDFITSRSVSTLVRMCKKPKLTAARINATFCLAYLIEESEELQYLIAHSDKLIQQLVRGIKDRPASYCDDTTMEEDHESVVVGTEEVRLYRQSCEATLVLLRSVCDRSEKLRVQVMNSVDKEAVFDCVLSSLSESAEPSAQLAALRCALSLMRSPIQLQTAIREHKLWQPVLKMLASKSVDHVILSSAIVCNLLLPLSSVRQELLDNGIIAELCALATSPVSDVRLNTIWALMNVSVTTDSTIKCNILDLIGMEKLITMLLEQLEQEAGLSVKPEVHEQVTMKLLGLTVNLSSSKEIVDIFTAYHQQLHPVYCTCLASGVEGLCEQVLMIISNLSNGSCESKDSLAESQALIQRLADMLNPQTSVRLLIPCVTIVKQLSQGGIKGCVHRQNCLGERGVKVLLQKLQTIDHAILHSLLNSTLDQLT